MKKTLFILILTSAILMPAASNAQMIDKVTLYLPNRVLDILDMFSLNIGVGLTARAELYATRAAQFGAGVGMTAKLMKDANRQYGYAVENGADAHFLTLGWEDMVRAPAGGLVQDYWRNQADALSKYTDEFYDLKKGARDYWAFGGTLGAGIIEVDVAVHPVEWLDAVLGFFFMDIKGDDLTFEKFR